MKGVWILSLGGSFIVASSQNDFCIKKPLTVRLSLWESMPTSMVQMDLRCQMRRMNKVQHDFHFLDGW